MAKKQETKHRTGHYANPDDAGELVVYCETCRWRDTVNVGGLSYMDGLAAIFTARDRHETDPAGLDGDFRREVVESFERGD